MSQLCLINALRGPVPPDGYRYVDPVSGFVSRSIDYTTWVEQEEKHLRANGREVPLNLGAIMEEQLCLTLPPGWCKYDNPERPRPGMAIEWPDVLRGAQNLAAWFTKGAKKVPQEEADRRALICSRCYYNVSMTGCSVCQAAVQRLSSGLKTRHDEFLKSCAVCKCTLKMKVHFPNEILDKENPGVQKLYPEHCWLHKNGTATSTVPG